MSGESELKALHDEVKDFVTYKLRMTPSGMSSELKGWPELMRDIAAAGKPEDIAIEQLRALDGYTKIIVDPASRSLGIGILQNDYRNAGFESKVTAALNKHPANKAFIMLQEFHKNQEPELRKVGIALARLGQFEWTEAAKSKLEAFADALERLNSNSRSDNYTPDLAQCRTQLDNPTSALRNPGFDMAKQMCNDLHIKLGKPIDTDYPSFGDYRRVLENVESQWNLVTREIRNLQPARTRP